MSLDIKNMLLLFFEFIPFDQWETQSYIFPDWQLMEHRITKPLPNVTLYTVIIGSPCQAISGGTRRLGQMAGKMRKNTKNSDHYISTIHLVIWFGQSLHRKIEYDNVIEQSHSKTEIDKDNASTATFNNIIYVCGNAYGLSLVANFIIYELGWRPWSMIGDVTYVMLWNETYFLST